MAGIDDRIEESKNWFERMAEHIPGYKGYKDKELRREADKTQRLFVAERLDSVLARLDSVKLDLVNRADLDKLGLIDVTTRKLRTVADKIRFADYGYAGLFDTDKVDEAVLDQLYQFDNAAGDRGRGDRDPRHGAQRRQPVAQDRSGPTGRQDRGARDAVLRAGTSHHRSREVIDGTDEPHRVRR